VLEHYRLQALRTIAAGRPKCETDGFSRNAERTCSWFFGTCRSLTFAGHCECNPDSHIGSS
jgi:hypothetical protein